jgi:hypothetical protein
VPSAERRAAAVPEIDPSTRTVVADLVETADGPVAVA